MAPLRRILIRIALRLALFFTVPAWVLSQWWTARCEIPLGGSRITISMNHRLGSISAGDNPASLVLDISRRDSRYWSRTRFRIRNVRALINRAMEKVKQSEVINLPGLRVRGTPYAGILIHHWLLVTIAASVFVVSEYLHARRTSADNIGCRDAAVAETA